MLVELRLRPVQERLKRTAWSAALRCRIPPRHVHRVPHLSLYTPQIDSLAKTAAARRALVRVCHGYRCLDCTIDGFGRDEGKDGHFVFYRIVPSKELIEFRRELAGRLAAVCPSPKRFETPDADFLFHITIAHRLSQRQADRLWRHLNGLGSTVDRQSGLRVWFRRLLRLGNPPDSRPFSERPRIPLRVVRVSLIGNDQRIVCEYDLPGQRLLSRKEALDRRGWRRSLEAARRLKRAER